jgi:hypothetical protein
MEMHDPANKYQNNSVNVDHNDTQLMQEVNGVWLRNGTASVV